MSAVDDVFRDLRRANKKAFIPFITAGYPDLDFTGLVVRELARRGCSICELGVPYSDPIADGPIIQASYTRALDNGIRLESILKLAGELTRDVRMPLVTMVSYAIIHRVGLESYVERARAAGITGAIVPDLLVDEAEPFAEVCRRHDFSLIQLVTPTTPRERALQIANTSTGFLYYVSVTGITGERRELPTELLDNVAWLRDHTELPVCIGFGISGPEQVRRLAPVVDGVIVGSAFVRRLAEQIEGRGADVIRDLGEFADELMRALRTEL